MARWGRVGLLALFLVGTLASGVAFAGESLFSRAYTTETVPEGHFELEQLIRDRTQRAFGDYTALDFKTEFEYGITNNFQAAFYFNTGYLHAKGAPDDNDPNGETGFTRNGFMVDSVAIELIYRVLNPVTDPLGLAFYYEPELNFHDIHNGDAESGGLENEFRILLQKNFLNDQLILVYNFVVEMEYFRYGNRDTSFVGELDWNNEIGLTYHFASHWYGGLEFRNHNEWGNFWTHDHSVFWLGPTLHYAEESWWATFGVLKQIAGNPNGFDDAGSFIGNGLFLHSHENWEITLKVGVPF